MVLVPDGVRVLVSDGQTRPIEGISPSSVWAPLFAGLPEPTAPRLLTAGADAAFIRAEREGSRMLALALAGAGEPWAHLQLLRGRAEATGIAPVLLIDAADPALMALPWELLTLGDEASGDTPQCIVRLAPGAPRRQAPSPTVAVWIGSLDETSRALAADIESVLRASGLQVVDVMSAPTLLWVVIHGERSADTLEFDLPSGLASASTVSARLGSALASVRVAVLAACHGGSSQVGRLDGLAGRLLAAGVGAVVAPRQAVPAESVMRFTGPFASSLGRGETLTRAVIAGREGLRRWAFPHRFARFFEMACWVCASDELSVVFCPPVFVPDGWPIVDPSVGRLLDAARRDAQQRNDGYLGVEHVLRSVIPTDGGGPIAQSVRRMAARWLAPYESVALALLPQLGPSAPPGGGLPLTPRLESVGAHLNTGAGLDDLCALVAALCAPGGVRIESGPSGPLDTPGDDPLATEPAEQISVSAAALEVLGGPEDGRRILLHPGDTLGRAGGGATIELFCSSHLTDRKLSREHLRWLGEGTFDALRPVELSGQRVFGVLSLKAGEILSLSAGTRLRAVA